MKLMIREFLASLKERNELDALLPDLLSELGYNVYSRPQRGTTQHGVDIAAVGDAGGTKRLLLFSVKQGDLGRADWDGTPQALRSSLNEILDVYIPTRIPKQYRELPVVICICFGGDVLEQVRAHLTSFIEANTRGNVSFEEWNGDRIAGYILDGVMRETLLPKELRAHFQKAVALVDEPDVAYHHFSRLLAQLRQRTHTSGPARLSIARQVYVCLWVLYVWGRDADNLEAPYRCSEIALLMVWELLRPDLGKKTKVARGMALAITQLIGLHLQIALGYLEAKILPHVGKRNGVGFAVGSNVPVDVNLGLFDTLGRLAMAALWLAWFRAKQETDDPALALQIEELRSNGVDLITNNPALMLPICDNQATDVALFLQVSLALGSPNADVGGWLNGIAERVDFAVRSHGRYPTVFSDYKELADHPRERSDEYRKEATVGSTLIPLLACWLSALGYDDTYRRLVDLKREVLGHCTLQLWMPTVESEQDLYSGSSDNGVALSDLELELGGSALIAEVADATLKQDGFDHLSAIRFGFWPIVLVACRHHKIPVPPQFWIKPLEAAMAAQSA